MHEEVGPGGGRAGGRRRRRSTHQRAVTVSAGRAATLAGRSIVIASPALPRVLRRVLIGQGCGQRRGEGVAPEGQVGVGGEGAASGAALGEIAPGDAAEQRGADGRCAEVRHRRRRSGELGLGLGEVGRVEVGEKRGEDAGPAELADGGAERVDDGGSVVFIVEEHIWLDC